MTTLGYVLRIDNNYNYVEPSGYAKEQNCYIDFNNPCEKAQYVLDSYENVVLCTGSSLKRQLLGESFNRFNCEYVQDFVDMFNYELEVWFDHEVCDKYLTTTIYVNTDMPERHLEYLIQVIPKAFTVDDGYWMFTDSLNLAVIGFNKRNKGSDVCEHPLHEKGQVVVKGNSIYQLCVCKECNESFMKKLKIQ